MPPVNARIPLVVSVFKVRVLLCIKTQWYTAKCLSGLDLNHRRIREFAQQQYVIGVAIITGLGGKKSQRNVLWTGLQSLTSVGHIKITPPPLQK